jgi:cell wall-associated NlpC family hydrolase
VANASTGFVAETDLNGRDAPTLDGNVVKVNAYLTGQTVNVVCQKRGEEAYGSTIWDHTTENMWVPDFYLKTGYSGFDPNVPRCDDTSGDVHYFPATTDLNGRNAPDLSATVLQVNQYRNGGQVPVVCQATGGNAYGSTIWDKTVDGVWVPDFYVKTGASGFAPGVPRCGTTTPPTQAGYTAETDLNGRNTTSLSAPAVKVYPAGSSISITCQAIGENAYGSTIWDKTSDGLWITDHYVKTGFDTFIPGMPRCADNTSGSGGGFTTETDLNGRSTKSLSAATVKEYPSGTSISITCQAYGPYAYGSYIWDKTSDGLWVTDYYVKTGTSGFVSNMPRCDSDSPSGGPGGGTGSGGTGSGGGGTCDTAGHGRNLPGTPGDTTVSSAQKIQNVINAATAETHLGLSYSWGAGGRGGPSCGISSPSPSGWQDYHRYGFDCSGFMAYIYWAGAGVNLWANDKNYGDGSNTQSLAGTVVPYSQVQPGDMIFWGGQSGSSYTLADTDHVAIYIGNGQIIEAAPPRIGQDNNTASSVHVTSVYGFHNYAVRIFT